MKISYIIVLLAAAACLAEAKNVRGSSNDTHRENERRLDVLLRRAESDPADDIDIGEVRLRF